jgi:hypothetical protein
MYCMFVTNITFSFHLFLSEKETEIDLCPPIGRLHKDGTNHKRTIGTKERGGNLSQYGLILFPKNEIIFFEKKLTQNYSSLDFITVYRHGVFGRLFAPAQKREPE